MDALRFVGQMVSVQDYDGADVPLRFFSLITRIATDGEALEQVLEDLLDACAKLPLIDLLTVLPRLLSTDCNIAFVRVKDSWPRCDQMR